MATVLIVDDIIDNRKYLTTLLRHQGHRLLEAADGAEGLAAIRAERPDLVVTDVLMPVMDGYEFVRQIRLDPRTSTIPVVFYTAHYGEVEARALALSNGVSYVLSKPSDSAEVLKIVGRALSGESESRRSPGTRPRPAEFERQHLRLLTDKLSEKTGDLRTANARLSALINIGLDLASEQDADRLLQNVCVAARDLFGATYVSLGIVDSSDRTVQRVVGCGIETGDWIKIGDAVSGILGAVVAERSTARGDNRNVDYESRQFPAFHPIVEAFLAVPVASPGRVYGWFCLVRNDGSSFSEDDEQQVTALAGQVGRIYENGAFAAVALKRARELEVEVIARKRAESALRHERDRAERYLETAAVILLALDTERRITVVNRYACAVFGWTKEELMGRDVVEVCVPIRKREETRKLFRTAHDGDDSNFESPIVSSILTRSGEERVIEWRNTVLRDDDGRVTGTFSSGTDITDRKHAVEALQAAEETMRFAMQNGGIGIWDLDFSTGALRWSEELEAQYGFQTGSFPGTYESMITRVHPEDREALAEAMATASKSGDDFSVLYRVVWPDGAVRWLLGAGRFHRGDEGEGLRGVGITQDVTERHVKAEQSQQAQKMEAIGRLAGSVAHDFNNLLTAILGYCELLLTDFDAADPRQIDITEIQKAGVSAAGLTRQLLAFSRKQIIEPIRLDLNVVVSDMRGMLQRLIREDVKVLFALRPDLACVCADRGQVEQIVLNLALNARDAMPKGGTLTIETANVELDEEYANMHYAVEAGQYVVLTVSDTGTGMTSEVRARLFEPFFTTKEIGTGTGLGLAIVHGIAKANGGSVNVYSEVGRGTSFKVYFRRADAGTGVVEAPALPVRRRTGSQTVLVVEDDVGLRQLTRRLLERQGYTVLLAANADEAVQLFEQNPFIDVLLTDVVMSGGNGPELTKRLIEERPGLSVVYMSGYTEDAIVQHGVLNSGIAFLHKPFTSAILGEKIREALDR